MNGRTLIGAALAASLSLSACSGAATPPAADADRAPRPDPSAAAAYTGFGFELFRTVAAREPGGNVFISPTSISLALAMTRSGAAGETLAAMSRVLGTEGETQEVDAANEAWLASLGSADPKVELSVANSLWGREGVPFREDYLERARRIYDAEVAALDFDSPDAARTINGWVARETGGRIDEIVPPRIDPATVLYLINAVYFKGTWADPFDPQATSPADFQLADGRVVQVPTMRRTGEYEILEGDGFAAARLPYGAGRFAMYLLLPDAGDSVDDLAARLEPSAWVDWLGRFESRRVALSLPRFTLEYEIGLVEPLRSLGMEVAFDPDRADFGAMLPPEYLAGRNAYLSEVKHKTFVEVNELGTEAAAATSVEVGVTSMPPEFRVDRPFLVAIGDAETGTVLFLGRIMDPR